MEEKTVKSEYLIIKKIGYLILTGITLLFATCAGRDAISAITSGKNEDVGYIVPAVVFGIVSLLCYGGFRKYSKKVDELFGVKEDPEEEDVEEE
ncbi:hypothetical protein LCGC14_0533280 [marine sediment metagenome]|uniref:Uncharacterized protein n=1 Tax=marine sediment metagenome TaxID=412755 RepID=A0A0F9V345_9ZZZZ